MKILVIIVTYNAGKWFDKCINSLHESSVPLDIYIIDNGSTDGTREKLEKMHDCIVFLSRTNLGFGQANNIGIRYAIKNDYDYLYLLNQDAWVKRDTIEKLVSIQNNMPKYGIVSPMQINALENCLDHNFLCNVLKNNDQLINDSILGKMSVLYDVQNVMAAHWLVSRDCFVKVGLFSPSFPHYGEDDNYIQRALFHGFKVGVITNTYGIHDREKRPAPKSKILYICSFIHQIVKLSDVNKSINSQFFKVIFWNIRYGLLYHSFIPIKNIFIILWLMPRIIKNKKISKNTSAFVK